MALLTVLPLVLLALLVPLLQLLPEPALVHQLLLVVRLQWLGGEKTLHQEIKITNRSHDFLDIRPKVSLGICKCNHGLKYSLTSKV